MSTSPGQLDRFLADLSGRRQRVLGLVGAPDSERAELVAELNELSEQLLVADEELRAQQEELEAVRRQLSLLTEDWEQLFELSTAALVLTDEHGVVFSTTRAAAQLIRQPPARRTPRPIATWFEVADRRRVRSLINQGDDSDGLALQGMRLRRSDGSTLLVDVTASPTRAPTRPGRVLRWELTPVELEVVSPPPPLQPSDLATELTALTNRLAPLSTVPSVLAAIVTEAVRIIPSAQHAVVVERHRRGAVDVLAATDDEALAASPHVLRVPLGLPGFSLTELRVTGSTPWGPEATSVAELLAVHLRVAAARVLQRQNLEHAMDTRQLIGQAVGVLVERRRLTPKAAFDELVQRSQLANLKLREIARIVVETGQDPDQITGP
jgi:PAS domain-containing protein